MKILSSESLKCEDVFGPFEWLLKSESIKTEVWRSMICQNSSALQEALLVDWLPLVQKAQDLYGVLTGQTHYNVTLPMILSEWHRLYNNSLQLGVLFDRLATELGGAYWMNWMPDNSTPDVTGILQQSAFFIMVNVGENIEKSQLWPDVKDYFHMLYWISNYRPGLTTQPPNCSMSYYGALQCDTGLKWPQFVQTLTRNLMSPNQDVLVNFLKGTVNLLQHVYGDTYKNLAGSFLKQEIIGGDALSAYLTNLLENLDVFVNTISMLPDRNITNPNVMLPLLGNLLQSTGLKPLLPLFLSDGPLNASAVLDVASKLGRLNQHIFTFNETDPTMPELERLIMQFLSLEGNLTMSLPHIMGHTLLTYSDYFNPDDVARLRKAIQPFTNQTSAGFVEAILRAMELLKKVLDAPDGDPTNIILGYTRQLQDFVMSLYRLRKIQHLPSSSGNLSTAQVTDLHMLSKDFLSLLTPEGLMNLTQAGQDAAQDIVAQKFIAFLPKEVQQEAARFLKDFKALQYHIIQCAAGQNCLTGVSEIFMFLDQILDLMLSADATPNISVSDVQNALQQSNLTLEELNNIAALAGAANINDLMVDIMELIKVRQCFEPQDKPMVTAQCVMGLINGVSSFLSNVPVLRNETAILSLIPLIVNNSISDFLQVDFSSNPQMAIAHTLNSIMANIKINLQQNQLSTPEIMKEIVVVEGLIQLIAISEPFDNLNSTLMMDPLYAQKVYLQIVEWYLKKLENITSTSSVSGLVDPFFSLTHMQVTLQLAQVDYSLFVSKQVEFLMNNLQNPIDAAGVGQIGQTTVELLRHLFELIMVNLETQNNIPGTEPFLNTTILHVTKLQVRQYLSLIQRWMKQPNVPLVIESMLQWASPSINISTPMTNLHQLLETIVNFVSADQRAYLAIIRNITQSLSKALMVAEKPGGLQSEQFSAAILETVRSALNILSAATGPLPPSVQQNILEIVQDSLKLIVQPEMSIASSRNISLLILKKAESLIKMIIPQPFAEYVLAGVELVTTYFESISSATGPNSLNKLILDEMEAVQSLLPPNSTAQPYISVLINITHFILESGQGKSFSLCRCNMSLWGFFESASLENVPIIFGQSEQFSAAILFAVRSALNILSAATGPLPPSVQQNILEIVQDSLKLIVQPEMSIASSRNISLLILKKAESLIKVIIPEPFAEYVLAGVKLVTTYFESISSATGPNSLNQLILDEMEAVKSLLPPNSTAQPYISVLINITHFILESGQGKSFSLCRCNMSLWGFFESASLENVPIIFGQCFKYLSAATGPLPPTVQQNILEIVQDSLKLIVQPEMSIASSRNISLLILKKAESLIKVIIPQPFAEYVLAGVELVTTYFESISAANGPNSLNQLILDEMEAVQSLLPPNSTAQPYISVLINITHFILESGQGNMSLWGFFESASLENMPIMFGQSEQFSAAILFAVRSALNILSAATGPLPPSVQQNILEIVQDSLKLIVQPEMSIASSRNISLLILKKAESLIKVIIPQPFAEYVLAGVELVTTYFESISSATGPNSLNQLILDEMEAVKSLLPPNSTAQPYISVLINITHFILESGQGKSASLCHCNMSLWASFESASEENVSIIFGQLGKLLSTLWTRIMGGQGLHTTAPYLEGFVHLAPVLEEVMTGKADKETWDKLEKLLESLLSTLKGTELWDGTPSFIPQFEKIIRSLVNTVQAQNVMIQSLQMPVVTLMREIAQSVNSTHLNLSEISQRMQPAVEHMLELAEQANGTLKCSEVLIAWEPVREAAGLSPSTMSMWCNIHLQPVLEAYAEAQTVYALMNMSHMGVGPMTVSATAARIVKSVQSLYHANMNSSIVSQQLIMVIVSQLSGLTGQSLSPEAELYWYKQLQDVQLLNSLSSFKMLSDELVNAAPLIQPYTDALEEALNHILGNYDLFEDSSSSEDIFSEAAMIFLSSANITLDNSMMSGNFSGLNVESLTNMIKEAVQQIIDMQIFGNEPMLYQALEQFLASNESSMIVQKVFDMVAWLASTKSSGFDLLTQVLPKIYDIVRPLLSVLTQLGLDMSENMELFEDLAGNIIAMLRQLVSTSGLLSPKDHRPSMYGMSGGNHTTRVRNRREAPSMMARDPMDDFIDLFYIDYPTMFKAISVPVSTNEILETVHVFFANPDMNVVVKGVTSDMPWGLNASREDTIDAALGLLSFVTLPSTFQMSSMDLLSNAAAMLPDGFPFSAMLKNITRVLAGESQENLMLMQETIQTAIELFQISLTDPRFTEQLSHLGSKVCAVEQTESVRLLMLSISIEPGQLCNTILPSLQMLVESLMMNTSYLSDAIFQTAIGEPKAYHLNSNCQGLGFNTSNLSSLDINITAPGVVTVDPVLVGQPASLRLHRCVGRKETDLEMLKTFCSLSVEQWYSFSLLMARHLNMEKLIYRMVLSEEMQGLVGVMLQMAEVITSMMKTFIPTIHQLQTFMVSVQDLNLGANQEFDQMARGHRSSISSKATFVTLSRALCSKGILALLGVSKLTAIMESNSSQPDQVRRGEMINRFKIPQDASPFCMNMYLDMVNTTGGAIAWAFLKPMLMGHILYTPDTPATRAIMEKANSTLNEFANLRKYSEDWIESSNYLVKSAVLLSQTLPMLQNSLGNSFVQRFIEMQTDINVDTMKETLSNFSNMTAMLEKNKHIMDQVTTLSTLMVNLSSCITFDRYRGYDTADELNAAAQHLAKNRDLYASVIFKLPKDTDASRKRNARASSSTSILPPKVSYTIRMHMDNLMRTDRVRDSYFIKDHHISARRTLRYNRGFVYLQENIDRAIIETQTGHRIEETAVQLQPFPYPCHYRDEYLEAIAFVFPLMLMIAWVLFVADFVKKLVHERELRLHEYMKMMGVNPLSHFFAWFLECASYLVLTVSILTLVLKYGDILPHSNGFILFLYLCNYSLSILSFSYLVSSFFDKTYIAGLSGSLLYILCFFPFIVVLAVETDLTFSQKSALSLFSPTCFSYASQYISRFESQGEGLQWSNSYTSPIPGDTASFGWLCWLMLIDSILYFIIGCYIRMVFPGNYGIASPWYFPFKASFWANLCCCCRSNSKVGRGLLFTNIMQKNQPVFSDDKGKGQSSLSSQTGEDFSELPVGVALHGLSKMYGDRVAIQNLNVSFYEGHVTSLLGHNGAGKTTTMSLLTGLFAPTSGTIEVYGRDMQTNIDDIRRELGVCMQYDVLFDHMTTKEHLLLYGQIKAPHWSQEELREQVRSTLEETGMYAHRHKLVSTLSGGMKRKLSISIAFIGGSRLVVLDEPTAGVDPCSRRNIWDIVIQHKK
ncbi:ATP-binding cassette sub-family A member 12, partial [Dissostichus eleginoides]